MPNMKYILAIAWAPIQRSWQDTVREEVSETVATSLCNIRMTTGACPGCSLAAPCKSCKYLFKIVQARRNCDLHMRLSAVRSLLGNSYLLWDAVKEAVMFQTSVQPQLQKEVSKTRDHEDYNLGPNVRIPNPSDQGFRSLGD